MSTERKRWKRRLARARRAWLTGRANVIVHRGMIARFRVVAGKLTSRKIVAPWLRGKETP